MKIKLFILLTFLSLIVEVKAQVEISSDALSTSSAIVLNVPAVAPPLRAGLQLTFKSTVASNPGVTINVNSSGNIVIKKEGGTTNLTSNDIKAGQVVTIVYDGTFWQMLSGSGNAVAAAGTNWTITGNGGTIDGTNFIGTTDDIAFNIRVFGQKAGRISNSTGTTTFFGYQAGNSTTGTHNSAFGHQALFSNIAGQGNTANGYQVLWNNSSGNFNTAMGRQALMANSTGGQNIAIGDGALINNTIGNFNTGNGGSSLANNTVGNNNAAYGNGALNSNVAGSDAIAIGYHAMFYANNNTTAFTNYNVALGFEALRGSATPASNTGNANTALGYQTLWSNTSGTANTASGRYALYSNTTGSQNAATGGNALYFNTTGTTNTANGWGALYNNNSASQNIAIGTEALNNQGLGFTNGGTVWQSDNVAVGYRALFTNQPTNASNGWRNTAIGNSSLRSNTTGSFNTAGGFNAMYNNTTGSDNLAIGYQSLLSNTTGNSNTAIGETALFNNTTGANNTANGVGALLNNVTGSNATAIGYGAMSNANNTATAFTNFNVAVGYEALKGSITPSSNTGNNNTALGYQTLYSNTSGANNTSTGLRTLYYNTTGSYNTATGFFALNGNTTGTFNTATGWNSLIANTSGTNNTANGTESLISNTIGNYNTALGNEALKSNISGNNNSANGSGALYSNTTGNNNAASGLQSLYSNIGGGNNTAQGFQALYTNTSGNNNTALGFSADVLSNNLTNATAIGYNAKVGASNSMVLGGTGADVVKVGINTTAPSERLDVVGNVKFSGAIMPNNIPGTSGQVLTSSGAGVAPVWSTVSGTLSGGTVNYLPKWTAANSLSSTSLVYDNGTSVGIGTAAPFSKLHVVGNNPSSIINQVAENSTQSIQSGISMLRSRGTIATPTAVQSGDYLGGFYLMGYDGTTFGPNGPSASMSANAVENFTSTATGTELFFQTTSIGTNAASTRMTIAANGNVGIGTTISPNQKLEVQDGHILLSNTGTQSELRFKEASANGGQIVSFKAPASLVANVNYTLPIDDGNVNDILTSDGTGIMSWQPASAIGAITGTGTLNYAARWTSATQLGTGILYDNGTNVGIGTTNPTGGKLDVQSTGATTAISAITSGTTGAGYFQINNASNSSTSLYSTHNGSGYSLLSTNTGTGTSGYFQNANTASSADALSVVTNGNSSKGINIFHTGATAASTDYGIYSNVTGAGGSNIGGYFTASGATNNYAAIFDQGNVGIGTTSPLAALDVSGQMYSRSFNAGASTAIDWNNSNSQTTSAGPGAFTFTNLQDGGQYTLYTTSGVSGTNTFTQAGVGFNYTPNNAATPAGFVMIYSFHRLGATVYVHWSAAGATPSTSWTTSGNSGTNPASDYAGTTDNDFVLKGGTGANIRLNHSANTSVHTASQHTFNASSGTNPGVIVTGGSYTSAMLGIQRNAPINSAGVAIGSLTFAALGSTMNQAEIVAFRDAASGGSSDIPTALTFWTTPDGTSTSAEVMRLTNSGNVGIGMNAPSGKLSVAGQIRTGIPLSGLGGATATNGSLLFYNSTTNSVLNIQSGATTATYTLTLPTTVASVANSSLISTTGGVLSWAAPGAAGAGLPTGSSTQTLRHDGTNWVANSFLTNNGTGIGINSAPSGSDMLYITAASNNGITVSNSNNLAGQTKVGLDVILTGTGNYNIGSRTTASGATENYGYYGFTNGGSQTNYSIRGEANAASAPANYGGYFTANGLTSNNYGVYANATNGTNNIGVYASASGGTSNVALLVPSGGGNVGIGLTAPASILHSSGQISTGVPLGGLGGASATNGSLLFYNAANTNTVNFRSGTTTASYSLILPTAVPTVSNSALISSSAGTLSWAAPGATGGGLPSGTSGQTLRNNGASWIANSVLYNDGTNIGIGTTSPGQKLHITDLTNGAKFRLEGPVGSAANINSSIEFYETSTFKASMGWASQTGQQYWFVYDGATAQNIVYKAGNFGIGTQTPGSRLEVVGNVEIPAANNYSYSTPKTDYVSLSSASFTTINALAVDGNSTGNARWISSGVAGVTDNMFATVNLPNGATITDIDVYVKDADASYEVSAELTRNNLATNINSTLATTPGTGLAAVPGITVISASLSSVVDNSTYMYYIKFNTKQNNTNLWIRGAIITYTVTKVD